MKGAIEFYVLMIAGLFMMVLMLQMTSVFALMQRAEMERDRIVSLIEEFDGYSSELEVLIQERSLCPSCWHQVSKSYDDIMRLELGVRVSIPVLWWQRDLNFISFPNISSNSW